jgi:hypothetical protein
VLAAAGTQFDPELAGAFAAMLSYRPRIARSA